MKRVLVALTVFLLLSFSVDSAILEENNCEVTNPVAYEVEYTVLITNNGPGTVTQIDLWIPVVQEYKPYQLVDYWKSDPKPVEFKVDDFGNKMAHIRLKEEIAPGESVTIWVKCKVQIYAVSCKPVTSSFEKYDKESELYKKYTAPEKNIESDNQQIKEKAAEITKDIDDPYLAAKKIYEFVINHMSFVRQERCRGALYALQEKKGDCTEYSDLFVALCRARGIPARSVHGPTHDWAEIYIPEVGWIPVDASWGRSGKDYFGNATNKHIILYKERYLHIKGKEFGLYYFFYQFRGSKPNVTHSFGTNKTKKEIWYQDPTILKEAESFYSEGEKCIEKGDYDTAIAKFQKAKELYSRLGNSTYVKFCESGLSFAELGKKAHLYFSEALGYFEKKMYSEAKSTFIRAMNVYGSVGNKQKRQECDTYISQCDTGIEADSLFEKGKVQIEEGALDEAKLSFENAQKKYEKIGDTEKVQQCQKMIQEIEKKNQEKEAEKEPEGKGFCLGTLFVALVVIGGSVIHLKRPVTKYLQRKNESEPSNWDSPCTYHLIQILLKNRCFLIFQ